MYRLKKIKSIESKIVNCIKDVSKRLIVRELKTNEIKAKVFRGKVQVKILNEENSTRKEYVILQKNDWTELHFILSSDLPSYSHKANCILFKNIFPKKYDANKFKFSTKNTKNIENNNTGATIAFILQKKYSIDLYYCEGSIQLVHTFETDFSSSKIIKEIQKLNKLSKKVENEISYLFDEIKKDPKKYSRIGKIW